MGTKIRLSREDHLAATLNERLEMSTAEIGLSVRTTNCLEDRGIFKVKDLLNCKRDYLLGIANFGEKTLEEVYGKLEAVGFHRPGHEPPENAPILPFRPIVQEDSE